MGQDLRLPPFADFATLYAKFPSFSLALAGLSVDTRVWLRKEKCYVSPSADGKHWDYELGATGPQSPTGRWKGPFGISGDTNQNNLVANVARGLVYRMDNYKAKTLSRLGFKTNGATSGTGGTDAFDIRLYLVGPDFMPLSIAPLYVWKYNAGGSGGAGTFALASIGAGAGLPWLFDLPGSVTASVPCMFMLNWIHSFVPTTLPSIYCPSLTGSNMDVYPQSMSAGDIGTNAGFDRGPAWTWAETHTPGAAPVFGSVGSPDQAANLAPIFALKFA